MPPTTSCPRSIIASLKNPTIPIVLNLQIYGDKRLSVANESDEAFQKSDSLDSKSNF